MLRGWLRPAIVASALGASVAAGLLVTHLTGQAACGVYWVGASGDFNTASNWSTGVVPGSADDVCITQTTTTAPPALADTYTITVNGGYSIRSLTLGGTTFTQTLLIPATGAQLNLSAASIINTNGVLTMGDAGTSNSALCCAGVNLTNTGRLNTVTGGGGARNLGLNVTNAAGGTFDIAGPTVQNGGGGGANATVNNGTVVIEPTSSLTLGNASTPVTFTNSGGSVTNNGTFTVGNYATFIQRAGTESGAPVVFSGTFNTLDDDVNAGAGLFTINPSSQVTLTGTGPSPGVAAGQVVRIGSGSGNVQVTLGVNLTNAGTLILGDSGNAASNLCCPGTTLTNVGQVNTVVGGGGNRSLHVNLVNGPAGTLDIAAPTFADGSGGPTSITNNGTIILEKGQTLGLAGGSTFSQGFGGTLATTIDATAPPAQTFGRLTGGGGLVSLNGLLKVTTVGSPWPGSAWPIISTANVSGQFASLDFGPLNYTVQYSATAVTLYGVAPCDYWIGGNGNFTTASNWSTGAVPTSADDVCVNRNTTTTPKAALDSYTVLVDSNVTVNTLTLGAPSGNQTLQLAGNNTQFFLAKTSSINPGGVLNVGDNNVANGSTLLGSGGSSVVLINTGRLNTVQGGGGIRYLRISINNFPSGTVDLAAIDTRQDTANAATTNNGTFAIEAGVTFAISNGSSFTNLQGSVTNLGSLSQNGNTFTQRGGTETGNPVFLQSAILDDDLAAGGAKFVLSGGSEITGTGTQPGVATGQVVTLAGDGTRTLIDKSLINAGTITLGDAGTGISWLGMGLNTFVLTNTGHLNTVPGGGGIRYLRLNITNAATGTVDVGAATIADFNGTIFGNNGTFTVEAGAGFAISNGGSFTNLAGSVTNLGSLSQNGNTFTQRGGTETGNPVFLQSAILDDDLAAGGAKFVLSGGSEITGTGTQPGVATGQVVTLAGDGMRVLLDKSLTNAGTITLGDAGTGISWLGMGTNTFVLTNTGHLNTVPGGGGIRYLRANITNAPAGIVDLAAPDSRQDFSAASSNNNGAFIIEPGSIFYLIGGSTFTQGAGGTFQTTIDANAMKFGQLNGGTDAVTLDGTLRVITVGHPVLNSSWPIISNANRSGMFPSLDFGGWNYDVQYTPTAPSGVTLVARGTCNVWIGGDGAFSTPTNWSLGFVPTSVDDACITATTTTTPAARADTYTVLVNGDFPVNSLTLGGASGMQTLNIQSGKRLTLLGNSAINARGVMILGDAGNGDAWLGCFPACSPTGPTLTNNGTLKTIQGGGGTRHIQVIVINAIGATLDIAGVAAQTDAGCNNPGGVANNRAIVNNGMVTVEAVGDFTPSCGFVNNAGATVTNHGTFRMWGDAFVQRGTESGNPVMFTNGSGIDDDLSAGPGSFVYTGSAGYPLGQVSLTGTGPNPGIPAGQVITIASTNTYIGIFPNMPNAGTIILGDNSGNGDSALCCAYFTSGATITNTGTIKTVQGGGGIRHLQVNVANTADGIIDIATDTRQDRACGSGGINATKISNDGTFIIEASGRYAMTSCPADPYQNTFTQGQGGTLQTTINGNAISAGQLSGGIVNLDGRLKVTTVGSPGVGYVWRIIDGAQLSARPFASLDLDNRYSILYSASSVILFVDPCGLLPPAWSCRPAANPPASTPGGPWWRRP